MVHSKNNYQMGCLQASGPYASEAYLRSASMLSAMAVALPVERIWDWRDEVLRLACKKELVNDRVPLSTKIQFMENYNWNPEMDSTLSVSLIKLWLNKFGLCKILKLIKFTISGFVCVFHPVVLGLNPKHSIHTFSIYSLFYYIYHCIEKRTKINKRKPSLAHFKNNNPHASINLTNYSVFK